MPATVPPFVSVNNESSNGAISGGNVGNENFSNFSTEEDGTSGGKGRHMDVALLETDL